MLLPLAVFALVWRGTGLVRLLERQAHGDGGWVARVARHGETLVESLRIIRQWHGLVLTLRPLNLDIDIPVLAGFVLLVLQMGTSVPLAEVR